MIERFIIEQGILKEYTLREKEVSVPESVHTIGESAFKGGTSIEKIILPDSVTRIMDNAFKGCRKLKDIRFSSNLIHIGKYAFHRCHSLWNVKLPPTVTYLSDFTFLYCNNLTFISMPGVKHLGTQNFLNDVNLKEIEVSEELDISNICDIFTGCTQLSKIKLSDGTLFSIENAIDIMSADSKAHPIVKSIFTDVFRMMEMEGSVLLKFLINLKDVEIPEGITKIGKSCFFDKKGINSIEFPKTLSQIESFAFRNCISLERIILGRTDITIHQKAFKNCTNLKYIILPDGTEYELKGIPDERKESIPEIIKTIHTQLLSDFFICGTTLFSYRGREERVIIPEGITKIAERAFAKNEAIGKVILPDTIVEIGEEAFSDCLLLQNINLPKSLKYIGEAAFENCVKLLRIELPEQITSIERAAFKRCRKLKEIIFSEQINSIKEFAFYGCEGLKEIEFPQKLTEIGTMAFYKCISLRKAELPKTLKKLGNNVFTASGIKSAVLKSDLQECGTDIFSDCKRLKFLILEEGVCAIEDKFAFSCPALEKIDFPSSLKYIGKNALEGSVYLKKLIENEEKNAVIQNDIFLDGKHLTGDVKIPDGVKSIAGGAFYGNSELTSVTLPESLQQIGARAFCNCTSLIKITLPSGITKIEEGTFAYDSNLETVIIKGEIYSISDNTYYRCEKLKHISLEGVKEIGANAFAGCKSLENITVNALTIKENAFLETIFLEKNKKENAIISAANIILDGKKCEQEVILPERIVSIAPFSFAGNEKITSIVFPSTLISVEEGAFYGCKNLREIKFSSAVQKIEKSAFEKCISLKKLSGNIKEIKEKAYAYCINLEIVQLQESIFFGKEAFCGCKKLESIICDSLQEIGEGCFSECESMKEFDFSNIKIIGKAAFWGCNSLKKVCFPQKIKISSHAFEDCGRLEELEISKEISFGSYSFSGCTALKTIRVKNKKEKEECYEIKNYYILFQKEIPSYIKEICQSIWSCFEIEENYSLSAYKNKGKILHIPSGIERIEAEVFKDALQIEEIEIPNTITEIGARAFQGTKWLDRQRKQTTFVVINNILIDGFACKGDIQVPENIKTISGWAFANCFELTKIKISSPKTRIEEYAFRNCIYLREVVLGDKSYFLTGIEDRKKEFPEPVRQIVFDCLNCFKTEERNILLECTGNIKNLLLAAGISGIGDMVFKESNLLTEITLAEETTFIGKEAFAKCKWLKFLRNGKAVKQIGKMAFSNCGLLEEVEFSDELEIIGERAFEHCTSLKSIEIPEGVTKISEKTFYRCKSLKKICLPSTLEKIEKEAFAFCYELEEIVFPEKELEIQEGAFRCCLKLEQKGGKEKKDFYEI